MSFTNRQKDIIRKIGDGSIVDLETCLEVMCSEDKVYVSKEEIEAKKKVHYEENLANIDEIVIELKKLANTKSWQILPDRLEQLKKAILDYSVKPQSFSVKYSAGAVLNYYGTDLYSIEDYTIFDDYRLVSNYLNSEGLIVLKDENFDAPNAKLARFFCKFIKKEPVEISKYLGVELELLYTDKPINNVRHRYGYYPQDTDYLDFEVEIDNSKYNRYVKEFFKSIIAKPELSMFIKRGFINRQEYDLKKTHLKTNIAIAISFIIGVVSIWMSITLSKGNTDFWIKNEIVENNNHTEIVEILDEIVLLNTEQQEVFMRIEEIINSSENEEIKRLLKEILDSNERLNESIINILESK